MSNAYGIPDFDTCTESALYAAASHPMGTPEHRALARRIRAVWLKPRAKAHGHCQTVQGLEAIIWNRENTSKVKTEPKTCTEMPMCSPSLMLSAEEVAVMLQVAAKTVRRWAREGRIPKPCRVGRLYRWSSSGIREWITRGCPNRCRMAA